MEEVKYDTTCILCFCNGCLCPLGDIVILLSGERMESIKPHRYRYYHRPHRLNSQAHDHISLTTFEVQTPKLLLKDERVGPVVKNDDRHLYVNAHYLHQVLL